MYCYCRCLQYLKKYSSVFRILLCIYGFWISSWFLLALGFCEDFSSVLTFKGNIKHHKRGKEMGYIKVVSSNYIIMVSLCVITAPHEQVALKMVISSLGFHV